MFNTVSYELNRNVDFDFQNARYASASTSSDSVIKSALSAVKSYLWCNHNSAKKEIENELRSVIKIDFSEVHSNHKNYSYDSLQAELATINEKCETRKVKGVYYTPSEPV